MLHRAGALSATTSSRGHSHPTSVTHAPLHKWNNRNLCLVLLRSALLVGCRVLNWAASRLFCVSFLIPRTGSCGFALICSISVLRWHGISRMQRYEFDLSQKQPVHRGSLANREHTTHARGGTRLLAASVAT